MKDTIVYLSPVGPMLLSLSLLGATAVAGEPLFPARQMERIQQGRQSDLQPGARPRRRNLSGDD